MKSRIVYEDKNILVVYKPAGLATQTARVGQPDVVSELQNYCAGKAARESRGGSSSGRSAGGPTSGKGAGGSQGLDPRNARPYIGVVHRLDQPVEGLLVFARDKLSAAGLSAQLGEGSLNKRYCAVVCGSPEKESGLLEDYLIRDEKTRSARVVTEQLQGEKLPEGKFPERRLQNGKLQEETLQEGKFPEGRLQNGKLQEGKVPDGKLNRENLQDGETPKKAILKYQVLKKAAEPLPLTLLDIQIETGRFHQIRAQLSHAGFPILGDSRYGNAEACEAGRKLGVVNPALCACELTFRHPATGKPMTFTTAPEGKIFGLF